VAGCVITDLLKHWEIASRNERDIVSIWSAELFLNVYTNGLGTNFEIAA